MKLRSPTATGTRHGPGEPRVAEAPVHTRLRPRGGRGRLRSGEDTSGLFVRSLGEARQGPRVVFLHGIGGTGVYWSAAKGATHLPLGAALVDLFGFGRSPRPLIRYTLDAHLRALEPVVSARAPTVLVGHSMGAALALAYARRHPEQVASLVLISLPAYGGLEGARRWFRQRPQGWFLTNMVLTALACMTTRRLLGPLLPRILRDIPPEVARDLVEHNFMSSTTSLWEVLYRHDPTEDLKNLPPDIPVLLIHGDRDATAPAEMVRQLVDLHPRARLVEFQEVDHHPWLRSPSDCAAAIAAWAAESGLRWDRHREGQL